MHAAIPPPARSRGASHRVAVLEVHAARPADPHPSRAEDHARRQAERLDARRRQERHLRELVAAIEAGDAAYRRLCDRLAAFDARLAVVQRTLSTTPAARPVAHAAPDRAETYVVDRSCLRATHGCMTYRPCGSI